MFFKKFLLTLAIIFAGNIFASNVHAEIKNFMESDTAVFSYGEDDEKIVATVKNVAKMRTEQVAKEKIFSYIKNTNKNLTDEYVSAVTNNIFEIIDVAFEKFSVSENAFENENKFMCEATVNANIETDKIFEYSQLGLEEKENIVRQNEILQKSESDINKNFDDLSANAENFSPEEIKNALVKIDKQISAKEKLSAGNKFYFQQDFQNAIGKYNDAIYIDENYSPAYVARGFVYKNLKNYDEAIKNFEKAIEIDFENSQAYYLLGQCYDILKNYDAAKENFGKSIEFDRKNANAYLERGNIYYRLQDYISASEDFSKIIELTPKDAKIYLKRGICLQKLGNYDAAVEDFTKALEINSNYVYAYYSRGLALKNLENYSAAIADFTNAIKLDLKYASAYYNRGVCYQLLGNDLQAEKDFKKSRSLGHAE